MENPYRKYLVEFFESTNYYYHVSYRIENLLKNESKILLKGKSEFYTSNAVVISDWTGPTEDGWELPFHTNVFTTTNKDNYLQEMEKMKSRENLLNFAQGFEVFQKFAKDCIIKKNYAINRDDLKYNNLILRKLKDEGVILSKDSLFKIIIILSLKNYTRCMSNCDTQ